MASQGGNGTGLSFTYATRAEDPDSQNSAAQNAMIAKLLSQSVAQRPEYSWTQGLARMAEALVSNYKQKQLTAKQDQTKANQMADMKLLGGALQNGNFSNVGSILSQLKDPQSLQMALNMLGTNATNSASSQKFKDEKAYEAELTRGTQAQKSDLDTKREQGNKQFEYDNSPGGRAAKDAENINKNLTTASNMLQAEQAKPPEQQNPGTIQKLQSAIGMYNTSLQRNTEVQRSLKGEYPNALPPAVNTGIAQLNTGQPVSPGNKAALENTRLNAAAPETALQAERGKAMITDESKIGQDFSDSAKAAAVGLQKGQAVLQMLANPEITSGPGQDISTKIKAGINRVLPGSFDNLDMQEAAQKSIGDFTLAAIGQMHTAGVQRVTEQIVKNVVPLFTPTLMDSPEGIKLRIEMANAMNPAVQGANNAFQAVRQEAYANPSSGINVAQAAAEIKQREAEQMNEAGMKVLNARLAPTGTEIIQNPNFDPINNPTNQFLRVAKGNPSQQVAQPITGQDLGVSPQDAQPLPAPGKDAGKEFAKPVPHQGNSVLPSVVPSDTQPIQPPQSAPQDNGGMQQANYQPQAQAPVMNTPNAGAQPPVMNVPNQGPPPPLHLVPSPYDKEFPIVPDDPAQIQKAQMQMGAPQPQAQPQFVAQQIDPGQAAQTQMGNGNASAMQRLNQPLQMDPNMLAMLLQNQQQPDQNYQG